MDKFIGMKKLRINRNHIVFEIVDKEYSIMYLTDNTAIKVPSQERNSWGDFITVTGDIIEQL